MGSCAPVSSTGVLVTGGAGFIGSHLVRHLSRSHRVTVLDNLRTGSLDNLEGADFRFIEGSVTDACAVADALVGCDRVVHLAAFVSVPESLAKPAECMEINVTGTATVLHASASAGVKTFVFASSSAVYGDNSDLPLHEEAVPAPLSPYAVSKLAGEYMVRIISEAGGFAGTSLRFFNVYGPRQDPSSPYSAVISKFIDLAARGESLTIFGNGSQTRDFIFVGDLVRIISSALFAVSPLPGVMNAGLGVRTSVNDLASAIMNLSRGTGGIRRLQPRAGDIMHSVADIERIVRFLGFEPNWDLEGGLRETMSFIGRP